MSGVKYMQQGSYAMQRAFVVGAVLTISSGCGGTSETGGGNASVAGTSSQGGALTVGTTYSTGGTAEAASLGGASGVVAGSPGIGPKLAATGVATSSAHACVVLSNGTVQCWGANLSGELGSSIATTCAIPVQSQQSTVPSTANYPCSPTPVAVPGVTTASVVAAGSDHACALLSGGTIECWGDNTYGELGNGVTAQKSVPVMVSGVTNATAVSAGNGFTCALLEGGTVKCWGRNGYGQLGNGTPTTSDPYGMLLPVAVSGITNAISVAAGESHACAVLTGGTIKCWGYNYDGELGTGSVSTDPYAPVGIPTPVAVVNITDAVAVSAGGKHTCARLPSGAVRCWGYNYAGQLGDGTTTSSPAPVTVSGINDATDASAGWSHTCAILSGGEVHCWGDNYTGELGNGSTASSSVPVKIAATTSIVAVTAGAGITCTLLAGGAVQCWGTNKYGQLGNGTTNDSAVPVTVSGF